jgi:hypothetical protein
LFTFYCIGLYQLILRAHSTSIAPIYISSFLALRN